MRRLLALPLVLVLLWTAGRLVVENFLPLLVWRAEVHGRVLDEAGLPVMGARVGAEFFGDRSADVIPGSRSTAVSGEDGSFLLEVVPGPVTLFAREPALGTSPPLDLVLRDGDEIADIELRLDPGGRIEGTCVKPDGEVWSGRWIAIEQAGYRHWHEEDRIAQMRTDANGAFAFERVPSGEVRVMVGGTSPSGPGLPFLEERTVTVERGRTTDVRFELARGGRRP